MKIKFEGSGYIKINSDKMIRTNLYVFPKMEIDYVLIITNNDNNIAKLCVRYVLGDDGIFRVCDEESGGAIKAINGMFTTLDGLDAIEAYRSLAIKLLIRRGIIIEDENTYEKNEIINSIYEYINNNRPKIHGFFLGGTQNENDKG